MFELWTREKRYPARSTSRGRVFSILGMMEIFRWALFVKFSPPEVVGKLKIHKASEYLGVLILET